MKNKIAAFFSGKKLYEFPLKQEIEVRGRIKHNPVTGFYSPFDTNFKGEPIIRLELTKKEKESFEKLADMVSKKQNTTRYTFKCTKCKNLTVLTDILLLEDAIRCVECSVSKKVQEFHGMKAKDYTPVKVLDTLLEKLN